MHDLRLKRTSGQRELPISSDSVLSGKASKNVLARSKRLRQFGPPIS